MANAQFDGGIQYVLTGHAHQVPVLSRHFDTTGAPVTHQQQSLRLSHSPSVPYEGENLGHSVCGDVADPLLDQISVEKKFGEYAKLILDRMPLQNESSFVGFAQVETAFSCPKIKAVLPPLHDTNQTSYVVVWGMNMMGLAAFLVSTIKCVLLLAITEVALMEM